MDEMATAEGPVATAVAAKLRRTFEPTHQEVINESSSHNVAPGSETHFKVIVISPAFDGMPLLERHRAINEALAAEIAGPIHALSIIAKTPQQWAKNATVAPSPPCLGGSER